MKKLVVLAIVGLVVAPALASIEVVPSESSIFSAGQMGAPRGAGDEIYQDITAVSGYGSQSVGVWAFDDLELDWVAPPPPSSSGSVLDTVKFTIYHSSTDVAGSVLTGANVSVRFYIDDLVNPPNTATTPLIGGFTVDFPAGTLSLLPGWYTVVTVSSVGIDLVGKPLNIFAGMMYNSITGTAAANKVGEIIANPPTVGSSTDIFFKAPDPPGPPAGSWSWFGGSPAANFYWELTVPEPTSLVLMVCGGLAFLRRRR